MAIEGAREGSKDEARQGAGMGGNGVGDGEGSGGHAGGGVEGSGKAIQCECAWEVLKHLQGAKVTGQDLVGFQVACRLLWAPSKNERPAVDDGNFVHIEERFIAGGDLGVDHA